MNRRYELRHYEPWEDPSLIPHTLARIGPAALPALLSALKHSEAAVRSRAVDTLELLGADAIDALPALLAAPIGEEVAWPGPWPVLDATPRSG